MTPSAVVGADADVTVAGRVVKRHLQLRLQWYQKLLQKLLQKLQQPRRPRQMESVRAEFGSRATKRSSLCVVQSLLS